MLSVSPTTRIFVHALPTDMRKSFDGLYALVVHSFGKDVFQGDYFVFVNRDARSLQDPVLGSRWLGDLGQTARTGLFPSARREPRSVR
jgi:transposase